MLVSPPSDPPREYNRIPLTAIPFRGQQPRSPPKAGPRGFNDAFSPEQRVVPGAKTPKSDQVLQAFVVEFAECGLQAVTLSS